MRNETAILRYGFMLVLFSLIWGCSGGGAQSSSAVTKTSSQIKVNQIGFLPGSSKMAIIPANNATTFALINEQGDQVFTANLSKPDSWAMAQGNVRVADFSGFNQPGRFQVKVAGLALSTPFEIGADVFSDVHDGALKAYYYNRASIALTSDYAGSWARPLGHPDNNVKIHWSAASSSRPQGTIIASAKGWYDAGDYNKYVVNSGISTYTLLAAFKHFPDFYQDRKIAIPETVNQLPDILDEVLWNLDWLVTMQDPSDGGVYHKLTTLNFSGKVMPHRATKQRYVVQKSTSASLNFAAVMAIASRVFAEQAGYQGKAAEYQNAAIAAYQWATNNSNIVYVNAKDVTTGEYGDNKFEDEFAWASAELYLLTQELDYLKQFEQYAAALSIPSWSNTMSLGYMSLLAEGKAILPGKIYSEYAFKMIQLADAIYQSHNASAYRTAMVKKDYVWGSNGVAMNKAMIALQAYQLTQNKKYVNAASGLVDYVFGKNPTGYSYVTGFGSKPSLRPHHRPSNADDVVAPVPGFLVGGPHQGRQDGCQYAGTEPATTYLDDWCSYSTNEVTINWNAPLVYVLAALQSSN